MSVDYHTIGYVGTINVAILFLITIWRCFRWYRKWEGNRRGKKFLKILGFHLLLVLTTLAELPLFIGFIVVGKYDVYAYSFHKFQAMFLFAALSITISDWSTVLYDIHEYQIYAFLFRRLTLIVLNGIFILISLINFIFCYWTADIGEYSNSPIYVIGIFFQICMSMFLTLFMLHAGLKLYGRIQGAAGKMTNLNNNRPSLNNQSNNNSKNSTQQLSNVVGPAPTMAVPEIVDPSGILPTTTSATSVKTGNDPNTPAILRRLRTGTYDSSQITDTSSSSNNIPFLTSASAGATLTADRQDTMSEAYRSSSPTPMVVTIPIATTAVNVQTTDNNTEFRAALLNLNAVMATCTFCILLQMIMVILNYSFHYENDTDKTVGPPILFWALYAWIPIWGPVLSLLYLYRSQFGKRKNVHSHTRLMSRDVQSNPLRSPLIGPTDVSVGALTDSENGNSPSRSALVQSHNFSRDLMGPYSDDQNPTPDQSRSYERYFGELGFDHQDNASSENNDLEEASPTLRNPLLLEDSMGSSLFLYRDTMATNNLPSELHIANVLRGHYPQNHDFSYRGEEEHNGQYR